MAEQGESNILERDKSGVFFAVGLDRADDVRAALSRAGFAFLEEDLGDCGCGGAALTQFRMQGSVDIDALERVLSPLELR